MVHVRDSHTTEFAFEIGSGLLTEVRRLQSLLGERDKAIQDMKEEKDDLERSVETLRTALKQQEASTGASLTSSHELRADP
jgi:cell division protein FtsB